MSPRSSKTRRSKGPAPESDIYVGLLFVSVASLITGIVFLIVEMQAYGYQTAVP